MKVIYIHKEEAHKRPPVLSAINHIVSLGHECELITCGINETVRKRLEDQGVIIHVLPYCKAKDKIGKLFEYYQFGHETERILHNIYGAHCVLWIEAGSTIASMGSAINKYRHILQIQELHQNEKMTIKAIAKVAPTAEAIVMPEYNRCVLYQIWFKLKKRPYVMPNIPAFLPTDGDIEAYSAKYTDFLSRIQGKRIVIYQGYVARQRPLDNYLKAIKELGDRYLVVLVGKDCGALKGYKEILPNLIHIDYLPSPEYLFFTKQAHIGIVTYDEMDLNNAYCAPNKIFEYANYGLPVLGNDIPGLKFLIEPFRSGKVVDEKNVESIKNAIIEIDKEYQAYSENSRRMIESFDNRAVIENILKSLKS